MASGALLAFSSSSAPPLRSAPRRRDLFLLSIPSLALTVAVPPSRSASDSSSIELVTQSPPPPPPPSADGGGRNRKGYLGGIANTKSWTQFVGDGFAIRVPPRFDDVMEPEDYNAGLSLYGDKVKPKTFAARFASADRSEVVTVVIRPSNQLKITFLEAQDITDLGSLKSAAKIFVPGGATLYNARTIKIKEEEDIRNYYYYEFGIEEQHVALMTSVSSGKVFIAGAAAPQSRWEDDGIQLRSAAISLSVQ